MGGLTPASQPLLRVELLSLLAFISLFLSFTLLETSLTGVEVIRAEESEELRETLLCEAWAGLTVTAWNRENVRGSHSSDTAHLHHVMYSSRICVEQHKN